MANVLDLQERSNPNPDETPEEEKSSAISLRWCYKSYISIALCAAR